MKILLYIAVIFFSILLSMTAFAIQFKQPFHLIDDNAKMSYLHAIDITQRDKYVFKACKIALEVKVKGAFLYGKNNRYTVIRRKSNKKYPTRIKYQVLGIFLSRETGKEKWVCDVTLNKSKKGKMEIDYLDVGGLWEFY